MATLTQIISSEVRKVGQSLQLAPAQQYSTLQSFGNEQYLHSGNLVTYTADYKPLVDTSRSFGFVNIVVNANNTLLNSNSTLNWMNTSPFTNANISNSNRLLAITGHMASIQKSNTDFILVNPGVNFTTGDKQVAYLRWKYGPNVANTAVTNANNNLFPSGQSNFYSGFWDTITYKGRVIVIGSSNRLSLDFTPGTPPYYDPNYVSIEPGFDPNYSATSVVNALIMQTNTNSFSYVTNVAFVRGPESNTSTFSFSYTESANLTTTGIASNGNYIVVHTQAIAQSSGRIRTSTDGLTWTNRTMSGAPANVEIRRTTFANSGNVFVFVSQDGNVYTSTDGFALTARTSPIPPGTGVTPIPLVLGQSNYSAGSNTNTFIILSSNTMLRTSNGIAYFFVDMDLDANLAKFKATGAANNLAIAYNGGRFTIMSNSGVVVYSTDDGATWLQDFGLYAQNIANAASGYTNYRSLTRETSSNLLFTVVTNSENVIPLNVTSSFGQTNPSLIGSVITSGGNWTRIK